MNVDDTLSLRSRPSPVLLYSAKASNCGSREFFAAARLICPAWIRARTTSNSGRVIARARASSKFVFSFFRLSSTIGKIGKSNERVVRLGGPPASPWKRP